ncbi:YqgQ family protein [Cerasibacillus sp. JNUCC 74]
MKSVYDIQQLLKRYGTFIYTGSRLGDLQMFEMELDELHGLGFIEKELYVKAKLILKKEITSLKK